MTWSHNVTGNTPPCELCLVPLKAWQGVSSPPPSPFQHVLGPDNIREGASRRGHEFQRLGVWRRNVSHMVKTKGGDYTPWYVKYPLHLRHVVLKDQRLEGRYPECRFPGPRQISAWDGWLSRSPLWSASGLCAGQEKAGSHICSANPAQKPKTSLLMFHFLEKTNVSAFWRRKKKSAGEIKGKAGVKCLILTMNLDQKRFVG